MQFNCVYCQYGWTSPIDRSGLAWPSRRTRWPPRSAAASAPRPRGASTGSPWPVTANRRSIPSSPPSSRPSATVRDRCHPVRRLAILANGTRAHLPAVQAALRRIDERYMKLDAGDPRRSARERQRASRSPAASTRIRSLPDVIVQSMFVEDPLDRCGNAAPRQPGGLAAAVADIRPAGVHIYTLAREPALARLRPCTRGRARAPRDELRAAGIPADVSSDEGQGLRQRAAFRRRSSRATRRRSPR